MLDVVTSVLLVIELYEPSPTKSDQNTLFRDAFNFLHQSLQFDFNQVTNPGWGTFNKTTGKFEGVVGEIEARRKDLGVAGLDMTEQRAKAVDYLHPIQVVKQGLCQVPPTGRNIDYYAFIHIFSDRSWLLLLCSIILLLLGYIFLSPQKDASQALSGMGKIGAFIIQRDTYQDEPSKRSEKLLKFVACITCFIVFCHYTAILTSLMTSQSPPSRIRSFQVYIKHFMITDSQSHQYIFLGYFNSRFANDHRIRWCPTRFFGKFKAWHCSA